VDAVAADILEPAVPNLQLIDFKLPPPRELSVDERASLMKNSVFRIWKEGQAPDGAAPVEPTRGASATEMWMLLIVRMVTRVAIPRPDKDEIDEEATKEQSEDDALESDFFVRQDKLRQTLCDYIMSDFPARCEWLLLVYLLN
jgi:symplekin